MPKITNKTKVLQVHKSVAIVVPKHIAEQAGIKPGDTVLINPDNLGSLKVRKTEDKEPTLEEAVEMATAAIKTLQTAIGVIKRSR